MKKAICLWVCAVAALGFATPGNAAVVYFEIASADILARFHFDAQATPDLPNNTRPALFQRNDIHLNGDISVAGDAPGSKYDLSIAFNGLRSFINLYGPSYHAIVFDGPLFSGDESNPIFSIGTFNATFPTATFSVSLTPFTQAVPEPATWAMMLAGFGLVGGAMRRGRAKTTVTYA